MSAESGSAVVARVDLTSVRLLDDANTVFDAGFRGKLTSSGKILGNAVVVGDRAHYTLERGQPTIMEIEPRRNQFSRRAVSGRGEQVVAANLDQVLLVAAVRDPVFKSGFADRVLCQASHSGIPAIIVLTKTDLAEAAEAESILADYARAGYTGLAVSAPEREGVEAIHARCHGRRSLFIGHSGVGKSTLLNALVPGLELLEGAVNAKTGKGRHTTTAAWLVRPEPGFELIDTPGVRVFSLFGIDVNELENAYPEFEPFLGRCRFSDCRHDREPGCALRAALASGEIAERRFDSFVKLRAELAEESSNA